MKGISDHDQMVQDFFKQVAVERPEQYKDVCKRNPVLSGRQWRRIRERETRLTPVIAGELGIDTGYYEDEDFN